MVVVVAGLLAGITPLNLDPELVCIVWLLHLVRDLPYTWTAAEQINGALATPNGNDTNCYERQSKLLICFRSTFHINSSSKHPGLEGFCTGCLPIL